MKKTLAAIFWITIFFLFMLYAGTRKGNYYLGDGGKCSICVEEAKK